MLQRDLKAGRASSNGELASHLLTVADPRAEGGTRRIELRADRVIVSRRIAGIAMQVETAIRDFQGVALTVDPAARGFVFGVTLVHRDADRSVRLYEAVNDADVVAEWKGWAKKLAVPKLIAQGEDEMLDAGQCLGAVTLGIRPIQRRRGSSALRRRPRFLQRRRTGDATRLGTSFEGEREIIAAS